MTSSYQFLLACKENNINTIHKCLEECPFQSWALLLDETSGCNCFHYFAMNGNHKAIKLALQLLKNKNLHINKLDKHSKAPVHYAIFNNWYNCVKVLLDNNVTLKVGFYYNWNWETVPNKKIKYEIIKYLSNIPMKIFNIPISNITLNSNSKEELENMLENKLIFTEEPAILNKSLNNMVTRLNNIMRPLAGQDEFKPSKRDDSVASLLNSFLKSNDTKPPKSKDENKLSLREKITVSKLPKDIKQYALEKENKVSSDFGSTFMKDKEWLETILRLPLESYAELPVTKEKNKVEEIKEYFTNVINVMNDVAYGIDNVKEEIVDCICQMISTNNNSMPRIICLQGSAGVGKTNLVRNGISKILNRPFCHINMGGISDSNYILGHETTYVGSKPGIIAQSLIQSKVMNPIIFMDEIDKISKTEKGDDIQNVLIHITDPVQNSDFQDKYFSGLSIDLSKVLFIFSCNDSSKISPILKDRIHFIKIEDPSISDKVIIAKKYIIKEITPNIGLKPTDISIDDAVIKYLINNYCKHEVGLRTLKRHLETILLKINTSVYMPNIKYKTLKNIKVPSYNPTENIVPIQITTKMIDEILIKPDTEFISSMFI